MNELHDLEPRIAGTEVVEPDVEFDEEVAADGLHESDLCSITSVGHLCTICG
jgi:hypothetical protein